MTLAQLIRPGDRVTIVNRFGQRRTGRAVMPCIAGGWVLDLGGRHGTPGIANDENTVRVTKARRRRTRAELLAAHRAADPHCTCNDCITHHYEETVR